MNTSWHSYPKIYNLGHDAIIKLFDDEVLVEEKIDGSQFNFGIIDGELRVKSKEKEMVLDAPEKMFDIAVDVVKDLPLKEGWTYRGEYLQKQKHNCLNYSRVPNKHIILFDVNTGEEQYLSRKEKEEEAARLGLEIVPELYSGTVSSADQLFQFLERESILGGTKIEGVVIKNYLQYGRDKKVLMGKYVSEEFKEKHKRAWGESNPTTRDIISQIVLSLRTEARWNKAAQHLRERGELEESVRDIGNLIKEVQNDIRAEEEEWIKDKLYKHAIQSILRQCSSGVPEWWKKKLAEKQFEPEPQNQILELEQETA